MSDFFLGEIRMMGFNYAPKGWAQCDGTSMPVGQNQALYSLLGFVYGGSGQNFKLPDLRGRTPIHRNSQYRIGTAGGSEGVTLDITQIPTHTHAFNVTSANATTNLPAAGTLSTVTTAGKTLYADYVDPTSTLAAMNAAAITAVPGSGQPHQNMQPSLVFNFCISLAGLYPSRY